MKNLVSKFQFSCLLALVAIMFTSASVLAGPNPQQLLKMIEAQQKQLDALKASLLEAQEQAKNAANKADAASSSLSALPNGLSIGGALEIEASNS